MARTAVVVLIGLGLACAKKDRDRDREARALAATAAKIEAARWATTTPAEAAPRPEATPGCLAVLKDEGHGRFRDDGEWLRALPAAVAAVVASGDPCAEAVLLDSLRWTDTMLVGRGYEALHATASQAVVEALGTVGSTASVVALEQVPDGAAAPSVAARGRADQAIWDRLARSLGAVAATTPRVAVRLRIRAWRDQRMAIETLIAARLHTAGREAVAGDATDVDAILDADYAEQPDDGWQYGTGTKIVLDGYLLDLRARRTHRVYLEGRPSGGNLRLQGDLRAQADELLQRSAAEAFEAALAKPGALTPP